TRPPRLGALALRYYRKRHQGDARKLMPDLRKRARHVIVRRHHDQRTEAAAFRPAFGLDRVAERVDGPIEVDATTHPALEFRLESRDFFGIGRSIRAADEQPL